MDKGFIEKYANYWDDKNSNEYSYVYLRKEFCEAVKTKHPDYDKLALLLYLYLASWGMLRNSFLGSKSYTVLIPVVKSLYEYENRDMLMNVDYKTIEFETYYNYIENALKIICRNLKQEETYCKFDKGIIVKKKINNPTWTLKTKILLGVYGCIPALDTMVENYIKSNYPEPRRKTFKSKVKIIFDYIKNYEDEIEKVRAELPCEEYYTLARVVDIYLWLNGGK